MAYIQRPGMQAQAAPRPTSAPDHFPASTSSRSGRKQVARIIRAYIPVCVCGLLACIGGFLLQLFLFKTGENELMNLVTANEKVTLAELPVHVKRIRIPNELHNLYKERAVSPKCCIACLSRELAYASRRLTSIEINGTFYRIQGRASFRGWCAETPESLVFSLQARASLQAFAQIARPSPRGLPNLRPTVRPKGRCTGAATSICFELDCSAAHESYHKGCTKSESEPILKPIDTMHRRTCLGLPIVYLWKSRYRTRRKQ